MQEQRDADRQVTHPTASRAASPVIGLFLFLLTACSSPRGQSPSAAPGAAASPTDNLPGQCCATVIRDTQEWSGPSTSPAVSFGNRGAGFQVRAIRVEGSRVLIFDTQTHDVAYIDRDALSIPDGLLPGVEAVAPPHRTVAFCLDRSQQYRLTRSALQGFADWGRAVAKPGDVFYSRWIQENSYAPEAEIMPAIRVPALLSAMPTPFPTPDPNDLFSRGPRDAATAAAAAVTATQAALDQATAQYVDQQFGDLRNVVPPPTPAASSDVMGCVAASAQLLADASGDRLLAIASDLTDAAQPPASLRLDGVRVRGIFLQCDDPDECQTVQQHWRSVAENANAADVAFLDPSEDLLERMP